MTKEITKAYILQELQDKFKLRDFEAEKFLFSETVIPTYSVQQHVERHISRYDTKSVTSTGELVFITVPDNERWHLNRYVAMFLTGAYTISGFYIRRPRTEKNTAFIYLDLTAAQSVSYAIELLKPVVMNPGDFLSANIDGYTSTGNLRLDADYVREEIR